MKDNAGFQLTVGSRYVIRSLESRDNPLITQGTFKGYAAFGRNDAICMELDEYHKENTGMLRIIPAHMIIAIDVLSAVENTVAREAEDEAARYFG
jgi:hypothetical protein